MSGSARLASAAALLALAACASASGQARDAARACAPPPLSRAYVQRVDAALRAKEDVWGNELLASQDGPSFEGAARYLNPLLRAKAAQGKPLTDSGAYYVAFSGQVGVDGSGSMALHVADGSQIVSQRSAGRKLAMSVGSAGRERFGSCLARLATPRLWGGFFPILETRYVDARGVQYVQESFAARIRETRSLVSFVRLTATSGPDAGATTVRFTPSGLRLATDGNRLRLGEDTHLVFGTGGEPDGSSVVFELPAGERRTVYVAWLNSPAPSDRLTLDEETYEDARRSLVGYWERRLADGMTIDPEARVRDAYRSLLVQNLGLAWRYSAGNPYQQFSYPEGVDVAQVLGAHGFPRREPRDSRPLARPGAHALPELEDRAEARRLGAPLPPLPRPLVRRAGDAGPPWVRGRARTPDRGEPAGAAPAGAVLVRHQGLGLRTALPGRCLARPARDG